MSMMAQSTTPVPILQAKKDTISFRTSSAPVAELWKTMVRLVI